MSECLRQGGLVAKHSWQTARQRSLHRHPSVRSESRARNFYRFFDGRAHVDRLEHELGRMSEVINLGDDFIQAINLLHHDLVEFLPEIRVIKAFGKKLRKSL